MKMKHAFEATIALAQERGMTELEGSELSLAHLRSMYDRILPEFSEGKLGRWLGWAQ